MNSNVLGILLPLVMGVMSCGAGNQQNQNLSEGNGIASPISDGEQVEKILFDADSAYSYVEMQVAHGPRVPNTDAHRKTGDLLVTELNRHGAKVTEQKMKLRAFDGTILESRNILGQYNPEASERILLLAHWDSRPWADEDPDPAKRKEPVTGANDGASGVGVLLEIARQLGLESTNKGIDILFADAEDWGQDGDDDSWAMGTRYFIENPPIEGYSPDQAILLDMVGGEGAVFCREYFSERSNPQLAAQLWQIAAQEGYGNIFLNRMGGAVTDDHVELIKRGIPSIDIIEFHPTTGFNERWHTTNDTMDGISRETLGAVGTVVMKFLRNSV